MVHLAVWRARADELGLNADDTAASLPQAIADNLGLSASDLLEGMPSLSNLSAHLEELIH
ncbi:hypothetical protein LP419_08310 [Massilia sp. H-1]|nr:hypothetical protein LP419_08310 [Massilia sp. H-1]